MQSKSTGCGVVLCKTARENKVDDIIAEYCVEVYWLFFKQEYYYTFLLRRYAFPVATDSFLKSKYLNCMEFDSSQLSVHTLERKCRVCVWYVAVFTWKQDEEVEIRNTYATSDLIINTTAILFGSCPLLCLAALSRNITTYPCHRQTRASVRGCAWGP